MKTKLLSILLFLPCLIFAQIINGDFEGGGSPTNPNVPNLWNSLWVTLETGNSYDGNHHAKLQTIFGSGSELNQKFSMPTNTLPSSFNLNFAYQSQITADSAAAILLVTDSNQNDKLLYDAYFLIDATVNNWTTVSLPLNPVGNANGDPNTYQISAFSAFWGTFNGNVLMLDAINLSSNTSIKEVVKTIKCYPNPTNGIVELQGINGSSKVDVYNCAGKYLQSTSRSTIDLSDYPSGIYFLKVAYGDMTEELRVVKE